MTPQEVMLVKTWETFVSPQSGVTQKVCQRSYGFVPDSELDSVIEQTRPSVRTRCSQDGRGWSTDWHSEEDGPESEGVWVERWTPEGCEFHGVVDSVSRKIVQVG